jgi:hypothetical protein
VGAMAMVAYRYRGVDSKLGFFQFGRSGSLTTSTYGSPTDLANGNVFDSLRIILVVSKNITTLTNACGQNMNLTAFLIYYGNFKA